MTRRAAAHAGNSCPPETKAASQPGFPMDFRNCSQSLFCALIEMHMPELLHRPLFVPGPAGRLESLLWSVSENKNDKAPLAAVVCHPHPLFGGTMHNKVVYQTAKTLHRFGLPVLRFNFRGVGMSDGSHDKGQGEVADVSAALDFLAAEYPGAPLLVAGFSFGSWVGLRAGCADARVTYLLGLGLPVGDLVGDRGFSYLDSCGKPKLLVAGEFDQYGPPDKLKALVAQFPPRVKEQTIVAIVRGADHFFSGHVNELDQIIATWLVDRRPQLVAREA
jgi:alpha/beta superfamily hydrolase